MALITSPRLADYSVMVHSVCEHDNSRSQ